MSRKNNLQKRKARHEEKLAAERREQQKKQERAEKRADRAERESVRARLAGGGRAAPAGPGGVRAAGVRKKKSARAGVARATKKNKVVGGIRVRDAESRARAIAILAERRGLKMDED